MPLIPAWHPMMVHFPLALICSGTAALSASRLLPMRFAETLAMVGTWNLCAGAVMVIPALGSGLAAAAGVDVGAAAHAAISAHVKSAMLTTLLMVLVGVWRGAGAASRERPSWAFLLVLWVATVSLVVTGYRGGQNVYRFGVGVSAGAVQSP